MLDNVEEFDRVIKSFHESGALKYLVLIGSWTVHVYQHKYPEIDSEYLTTQDVDFSVHGGYKKVRKAEPLILNTLRKMGYDSFPKGGPPPGQVFKANIAHGENRLSIEFLCAPGRMKKPYLVEGLGVIATPLEFQDYLLNNTEVIQYKGLPIIVPLREYFAAHKVSISQQRRDEGKGEKDLLCAKKIIEAIGHEKVYKIGTEGKTRFHKSFMTGWKKLAISTE